MSDLETTTMNLTNDVTVNGIKYRAGNNVTVPKKQADDIARMDYEHNKYLKGLHEKHTYEVNAGTIGVGGN